MLQANGVAAPGNPALLASMIRICAGGLIALAQEIKGTSGVDLTAEDTLEEMTDLIIRVFLPGMASDAA